MNGYLSGQDKPPWNFPHWSCKIKFFFGHVIKPLLVKMAGFWPLLFFFLALFNHLEKFKNSLTNNSAILTSNFNCYLPTCLGFTASAEAEC